MSKHSSPPSPNDSNSEVINKNNDIETNNNLVIEDDYSNPQIAIKGSGEEEENKRKAHNANDGNSFLETLANITSDDKLILLLAIIAALLTMHPLVGVAIYIILKGLQYSADSRDRHIRKTTRSTTSPQRKMIAKGKTRAQEISTSVTATNIVPESSILTNNSVHTEAVPVTISFSDAAAAPIIKAPASRAGSRAQATVMTVQKPIQATPAPQARKASAKPLTLPTVTITNPLHSNSTNKNLESHLHLAESMAHHPVEILASLGEVPSVNAIRLPKVSDISSLNPLHVAQSQTTRVTSAPSNKIQFARNKRVVSSLNPLHVAQSQTTRVTSAPSSTTQFSRNENVISNPLHQLNQASTQSNHIVEEASPDLRWASLSQIKLLQDEDSEVEQQTQSKRRPSEDAASSGTKQRRNKKEFDQLLSSDDSPNDVVSTLPEAAAILTASSSLPAQAKNRGRGRRKIDENDLPEERPVFGSSALQSRPSFSALPFAPTLGHAESLDSLEGAADLLYQQAKPTAARRNLARSARKYAHLSEETDPHPSTELHSVTQPIASRGKNTK